MPDGTMDKVKGYIVELDERASTSQAEAGRTLNPLFRRRNDRKGGPRDFVASSYLYMRSCDADVGSRPAPCPAFWLSPDVWVTPLSNLGTSTRKLTAGSSYRLTATVRNRGDLMVPSAKVEFWLVNPSLGCDVRYSTRIGVVDGRVQAYGAAQISLDFTVPPTLSGHRCLFARVFSFAPLDIPVDDHALDPVIDRHVAQLNLDIVAEASTLTLDWIHLRNAAERLEIIPMTAATLRALLRVEAMTPLTLVSARRAKSVLGKFGIELVHPDERGPAIETERTETGVELRSVDREAVSLERQAELMKQVQAAIASVERRGADTRKFKDLFKAYRAMTTQSVRTQVVLKVPEVGLKSGEALPVHVIRRDIASGQIRGGIAIVIAGPER